VGSQAIGVIEIFAANFKFGHQFKVDLARATSIEDLQHRAAGFFSHNPATLVQPTVAGL
jgi:hypothetical protein